MIAKIVRSKRQEVESRESAMSQLFGLESFVLQRGSRKTDYSEDFDLQSEIMDRLAAINLNSRNSNTVLFGESGSGKSLFLLKLLQLIDKDARFKNKAVVLFKLRDLSGDNTDT